MVVRQQEEGFTVVEMIVTLVVMSLFLTLFFQTFFTSQAQQTSVVKLAAANNIAQTNLSKISSKALIPSGTVACSTSGSSPNNPLANPSLAADAGSIIATNATSGGFTTPTWANANMTSELLATTSLPTSGTVQILKVRYPQGCDATAPAQIISIVEYPTSSGAKETAIHAAYVN